MDMLDNTEDVQKERININSVYNSIYQKLQRKFSTAYNKQTSQMKTVLNIIETCKWKCIFEELDTGFSKSAQLMGFA